MKAPVIAAASTASLGAGHSAPQPAIDATAGDTVRALESMSRASNKHPSPAGDVSDIGSWGVFVYFVAVLLAVGCLFAIPALPGNSTDLFPGPGPDDLVQVVQWIWEGTSNTWRCAVRSMWRMYG